MKEIVLTQQNNGVCTITLNRPQSLNAMNRALIDQTAVAFREANQDPQTRAIVFTGAGRAFCAGDDLREHRHPQSEAQAREQVEAIQQVTREIVHGPKPVVGAINGWAVGGGFEWAINCDFAIWAESANGFFPEVYWGLFVTGAVTSLLPALVGMSRAKEMLLLGQKYDAKTLLDYGVAWQVVKDDELLQTAVSTAEKLASFPPRAVQDMKKALNQSAYGDARSIDRAMDFETVATIRGFLDPESTKRIAEFGKH